MKKDLRIGGFTPFTAIDYPGALSAVVFCQGCPWRCRYCHNSDLLPAKTPPTHQWDQLLEFLSTRKGLLDAVVFSGGEPTAQGALTHAIEAVRALGFKIGLHTAGMYPRRIAQLLPRLDWVGLDIKALPQDYPAITGVEDSGAAPWQSAQLLADAGIPLQVRLTRHPQLTSDQQLAEIRQRLNALGISALTVQACNSHKALDTDLRRSA